MGKGEKSLVRDTQFQMYNLKWMDSSEKSYAAIILYPSLMTPLVVGDDKNIEILILSSPKSMELNVAHVVANLVVQEGLGYGSNRVAKLTKKDIVKDGIKKVEIKEDEVSVSIKGLKAIFDKRAFDSFKNEFDKTEGKPVAYTITIDKAFFSRKLKFEKSKKIITQRQDYFISEILKGQGNKDCFSFSKSDIDYSQKDSVRKIIAHHPVFIDNKNKSHFNFGHLTDIHLSSRQHILKQSNARVIELGKNTKNRDDISPKIGDLLNISSENFKCLLDKMGRDKEVDALLIGGDLVDYLKNVIVEKTEKMKTHEIWDHVKMPSGDNDPGKYVGEYIDFIAFYTFMIYFYEKYQKPAFVVSGNHDAYFNPYGISPKIAHERANEGIPADHNLTIYEAILAFGETAREAYVGFPMKPEMFAWFYTVFTPFSDFSVELKNQMLVGLAWGEDEDFLDPAEKIPGLNPNEQGFGHLPRSEDAISIDQKKLLTQAVYEKGVKKIILLTHFTFASYSEKISNKQNKGKISLSNVYGPHDMGTFHENRESIRLLNNIQVTFTGHSHRRGAYTIKTDLNKDEAVTEYFTFDDEGGNLKEEAPLIVVSDSAGPMPRRNETGEFSGWGSDRASGTKVVFNSDNGSIARVESIKVGKKPRFSVAMDYQDLLVMHDIDKDGENALDKMPVLSIDRREFESFVNDVKIPKDNFAFATQITAFNPFADGKKVLDKNKFMLQYNFFHHYEYGPDINSVYFYIYDKYGACKHLGFDVNAEPIKSDIFQQHRISKYSWSVEDSQLSDFRYMLTGVYEKLFVSVGMKSDYWSSYYDMESRWNFEVAAVNKKKSDREYFLFRRDENNMELPDFEWRKKVLRREYNADSKT